VAGLAGAVLVLGACGGGGSGDGSIDVATGVRAQKLIAASADKADAAGTARMKGGVTITGKDLPSTPRFEMDGIVDFETGALEFSMDMSGILGKQGGPGFQMRMRQVDGVGYMGFDADGRAGRELDQLTGGKEWIRIDPGSMGITPEGTGDSDPGGTMDALRGISDVEVVGSEKVGGQDTTHYRGTIDLSKAADQIPESFKGKDMMQDMFGRAWDVDVWVAADGMARKVRMEVDGRMHMVEEFEYYDFGVPVDLSAPPAGEVADFNEVFGPYLGQSGSVFDPAA
jgi:hypothetical protein